MVERAAEHDRALRSFDVHSREWREAVEATVLSASQVGGRGPVGRLRAAAITDGVLALIEQHAEDLEPVLASLQRSAWQANRETERSAARRARVEHAVGLAVVVPGEVVQGDRP